MRTGLFFVIATYFCLVVLLLLLSPALRSDLNFAMDDGYIYANYVRNAADGHFFEYNVGEKSGGITGFLWFLLWIPAFLVARLGWQEIVALHISSYVLSLFLMIGTLSVLFHFANRLYDSVWVSVLVCLMVAGDLQLLWGALSGLEIPLTTFFVCSILWAAWEVGDGNDSKIEVLGHTLQRTRCFEHVLVISSLAAFSCRPESVSCVLGVVLFLFFSNKRNPKGNRLVLKLIAAAVAGSILVCCIYYGFTGSLLASSYYAKVGLAAATVPRPRLWNAYVVLQQFEPYEILLYTLFAFVLVAGWFRGREIRSWLLPFLFVASFYVSKISTFSWLGQEHRYVSPLRPVIILYALPPVFLLIEKLLGQVGGHTMSIKSRKCSLIVGMVLCFLIACAYDLTVVSPKYNRYVSGRIEGDIAVGKWIHDNTEPHARVASEPIGSIHLYSERYTIDIAGLTTSGFAGHFPRWSELFPLLQAKKADYLVYYPKWFANDGLPSLPPWLCRVASFDIEGGNTPPYPIGSSPIEVYRIDWSKYK